ncbi:hypothetical protein HDV05_000602, partial [Chytridiales sp. JEL 0842]
MATIREAAEQKVQAVFNDLLRQTTNGDLRDRLEKKQKTLLAMLNIDYKDAGDAVANDIQSADDLCQLADQYFWSLLAK